MSKIVVECNNSGSHKVQSTLQHLENCSNDKVARVIRIGGDERLFDGSKDNVHSLIPIGTGCEFECNDSAYPTVIGILKHLERLTLDLRSRVIRIGGDERTFDGNNDAVLSIIVDGNLNADAYVSAGRLKNRSRGASRPKTSRKASRAVSTPPVSNYGSSTNLSDNDVDTIKTAVTEKMSNREMFTAFDITKKVRSDGMRVFHNDVKSVVMDMHQTLADEGYTRTPMRLFNSRTAMVYHRIGDDPNNYANLTYSHD